MRGFAAFAACLAFACGSSGDDAPGNATSGGGSGGSAGSATGGNGGSGGSGAIGGVAGSATGGSATGGSATGGSSTGGAGGAICSDVTDASELVIATASSSDEYLLELDATSASHTSWAEAGNEALILEVKVAGAFRSHLVLHHGADGGTYSVALGAVTAGEEISVVVSTLSAQKALRSACIGPVTLTPAASIGNAEGLVFSPILKWPLAKRFDDLPLVLGWSKAKKEYQVVFSNENGGTIEQCGGGAEGVEAEIARWGRALDIERAYHYGTNASWNRCTGSSTFTAHAVTKEAEHPIFYYGDGHNRLYESRAGYGQGCGSGGPEKADGDLVGWNVQNPGNAPSLDAAYALTIRLAPVSLDALGFAKFGGRREALADRSAPWAYRLLDSELEREGKIDHNHSWSMQEYVYADVYAADVGGSGDEFCTLLGVGSGFRLRVKTNGTTHDGPQMTADYFGGQNAVKRIAIPLGQTYAASAFTNLVFDAYDDDGIYWLGLGDVFVPRPKGDNGATIDIIHPEKTDINVYVDDDSSNCTNGQNPDGPAGSAPCVGGQYDFPL